MSAFIGIDLGTTFSAVAHIDAHGRPAIVPSATGAPVTPSVICFSTDPPAVGEEARMLQAAGSTDVAAFFKRSMGDSSFALEFSGRLYSSIDLSAIVLAHLKQTAERHLNEPIVQAVITVPAYFTNAQRQATIDAGRQAELDVLHIINEPTAAALAYGIQPSNRTETLLVYDLGGGSFDVTLVRVTPEAIEVLATDGDHNLGGKDWDDRLTVYLAERFCDEHGIDPLNDASAAMDLLLKAETAKRALSSRLSVTVKFDYQGHSFSHALTREQFDSLTADLMERTQQLTEQALRDARLDWTELAGVLLVGGSTRMPMVHRYVERMSGKPPRTGVNVDEAVALGAAVQAALVVQQRSPREKSRLRLGTGKVIRDVMSHSLGMIAHSPDGERYLNSIIVQKNLPIPCRVTRPYQFKTRARGENRVEVYVTQGETSRPSDCSFLGKYSFSNIAHSANGPSILDVAYSYDSNGVVGVSAVEHASGATLPVTVEAIPADMSWLDRPPQQQEAPAHVTAYLCFDVSGSMSGSPLEQAKEAARAFVRNTDLANNSIGLTSFADSNRTDSPACQDASALERAIGGMAVGLGGCNSATPFAHVHGLLRNVENPRFIIVLTDGIWSCQEQAVREAAACHADGIEVIAIGFGGADGEFLRRIATADENSFYTRLEDLVETFSTIAQELTESSGGGLRLRRS